MFTLSYVLGNMLFYVSDVLIYQIRVRLPQISSELHVPVVAHHCYREHILLKYTKHGTKHINPLSLHKILSYSIQQSYCVTLVYKKSYLTRKNNIFVHCTHTKKFPRPGQKI